MTDQAAPPPALVEALAGAYEVLQEIGRGGMGVVYAAREVTAGEIDGRSDLYSLGVVAFEALASRLPFDGPAPAVIVAHATMVDVARWRTRNRCMLPLVPWVRTCAPVYVGNRNA